MRHVDHRNRRAKTAEHRAGYNLKTEIPVDSGEVRVCKGDAVLRASAIGSCVVVAIFVPDCRVGGMAHVMLPGASRGQDSSARTRYAEDAMQEMMLKMANLGTKESRMYACLIGGGNLLGDDHYTPGPETAQSLTEILRRMNIEPTAMEVGGTQRRSCSLDVGCGRVTYTVGDSTEHTLWEVEAFGPGSAEKEKGICRHRMQER
jgi:chemotaxis protein CheD